MQRTSRGAAEWGSANSVCTNAGRQAKERLRKNAHDVASAAHVDVAKCMRRQRVRLCSSRVKLTQCLGTECRWSTVWWQLREFIVSLQHQLRRILPTGDKSNLRTRKISQFADRSDDRLANWAVVRIVIDRRRRALSVQRLSRLAAGTRQIVVAAIVGEVGSPGGTVELAHR